MVGRVSLLFGLILGSSLTVAAQATLEANTHPPPPSIPGGCEKEEHTLLLDSQTVLRNVRWRIKHGNPDGSDRVGCGIAIPHRQATGHFWFFSSDNIELTCKALDGTALTGAYWVFCAALTDVEWWMDALNNGSPDIRKQYYNAPSKMASFGDVNALPPGPNKAPVIVNFDSSDCGKTFVFRRLTSGTVSVSVGDADQDSLIAAPKGLNGEVTILPPEWNGEPFSPNGLKLYPHWHGQIPGSGAALVVSFYMPDQAGDFIIGIDVTDGKALVPTRCTIGLQAM